MAGAGCGSSTRRSRRKGFCPAARPAAAARSAPSAPHQYGRTSSTPAARAAAPASAAEAWARERVRGRVAPPLLRPPCVRPPARQAGAVVPPCSTRRARGSAGGVAPGPQEARGRPDTRNRMVPGAHPRPSPASRGAAAALAGHHLRRGGGSRAGQPSVGLLAWREAAAGLGSLGWCGRLAKAPACATVLVASSDRRGGALAPSSDRVCCPGS